MLETFFKTFLIAVIILAAIQAIQSIQLLNNTVTVINKGGKYVR
jgi:hypothetical protein